MENSTFNKHKVLFIDQQIYVNDARVLALQEINIEVEPVHNIYLIENIFEECIFDLVIADLNLKYDGIEIIKIIRSKNVHCPVIALVDNDDYECKIKTLQLGGDDCLLRDLNPALMATFIELKIQRYYQLKFTTNKTNIELLKDTMILGSISEDIDENEQTQITVVKTSAGKPKNLMATKERESKKEITENNFSFLFDSILRRLIVSLSLVSLQDIKNCIQLLQKKEMKGKSFYQLLQYSHLLSKENLDNICFLKNIDGISLIPGYETKEFIAQGGMGLVYKGINLNSEEIVAIKVVVPVSDNPTDIKRFIRECELSKQIKHSGIVETYEFGEVHGLYYMIMEYVDGNPLSKKIKQEAPMLEKEALAIFEQILNTLTYAWSQGIIHRDIKPDNIIVTSKCLKICDLGLAKALRTSSEVTQQGMVLGTPYYMSPEQFLGQDLDYRTDLYSLGICFFIMLTGELPFQGNNFLDLGRQHTKHPIPHPESFGITLSPKTTQFLYKLLAKNPDDRCQNITEIWTELENLKSAEKVLPAPVNENRRYKMALWVTVVLILTIVFSQAILYIKKKIEIKEIRRLYQNSKYSQVLDKAYTLLQKSPDSGEVYKWQGNAYLQMAKYRQAHNSFLQYTLFYPKTWEGYYKTAITHYLLGEVEPAIKSLIVADGLHKTPQIYYTWARIYYQVQNIPVAKKRLQQALELDPEYWQAQYLMSFIQPKKSLDLVEKIARKTKSPWINFYHGVLLMRHKKIALAQKKLQQSFAGIQTQEAAQLLGQITLQQKQFEKSVIWFHRAAKCLSIKDIVISHQVDTFLLAKYQLPKKTILKSKIKAHFSLNNYKQAIKCIYEVLEIAPKSQDIQETLLLIYQKQKNHQKALNVIDKLVSLAPNNKSYQLERGKILLSIGQFSLATQIFNQLLEQSYEYSQVVTWRGYAYLYQKNFTKALEDFHRSLQRTPDNVQALLGKGMALQKIKKVEKARLAYHKIIETAPNHPSANQKLASIYMEQGKYLRVIQICNRLLMNNSSHQQALYLRAHSYLELKRYKNSIQDFTNLIKYIPDHILAFFNRGIAHYQLNNLAKASQDFNQVVKLVDDKNDKRAKEARRYLVRIKNKESE